MEAKNKGSMNESILCFLICLSVGLSCAKKRDLVKLLKSDNKDEIISGAYYTGESESPEYVPLLLTNAADPRRSTNLRFYGIAVYEAKMAALGKIYKKYP